MNALARLLSLTTLVGTLIIAVPGTSEAALFELTSIAASGLLDGSPAVDPFPGIIYSELDTAGPGSVWLSLVKFDLSSLAGFVIDSATFELTSNFNHSNGAFQHEVFSTSDDSWTEATLNGVNRPGDGTLTLLDATTIDGTSTAYTWSVTAGVAGGDGLGGNAILSLLIRPELSQAGGNGFGPHFNDRGSLTGPPRLIIEAHQAAAVPEPSSLALLGISLVAVRRGLRKR